MAIGLKYVVIVSRDPEAPAEAFAPELLNAESDTLLSQEGDESCPPRPPTATLALGAGKRGASHPKAPFEDHAFEKIAHAQARVRCRAQD